MALSQHPPIERLRGRENYDSWKFAVQAYLEDLELWECVEPTTTEGVIAAVDPKKDKKCRAKVILLIDPLFSFNKQVVIVENI
ncbi:hypothetical protein NQ318_006907 [Aromia moschata]|uniref:DUF4219 domain-containing protein n=1 Tax=Aromia moschata TaxID=1265417 RepID=A0AAV8X9N5_9CUCU|nr:hypothetical protein NQ318_006907 [Aromia moschata]